MVVDKYRSTVGNLLLRRVRRGRERKIEHRIG
jgi:hypothetical protein